MNSFVCEQIYENKHRLKQSLQWASNKGNLFLDSPLGRVRKLEGRSVSRGNRENTTLAGVKAKDCPYERAFLWRYFNDPVLKKLNNNEPLTYRQIELLNAKYVNLLCYTPADGLTPQQKKELSTALLEIKGAGETEKELSAPEKSVVAEAMTNAGKLLEHWMQEAMMNARQLLEDHLVQEAKKETMKLLDQLKLEIKARKLLDLCFAEAKKYAKRHLVKWATGAKNYAAKNAMKLTDRWVATETKAEEYAKKLFSRFLQAAVMSAKHLLGRLMGEAEKKAKQHLERLVVEAITNTRKLLSPSVELHSSIEPPASIKLPDQWVAKTEMSGPQHLSWESGLNEETVQQILANSSDECDY